MRIYDGENDTSLDQISIYLTTSEIAQLHGLLGAMMRDVRAKQSRIKDQSVNHSMTIIRYSEMETVNLNPRLKKILVSEY